MGGQLGDNNKHCDLRGCASALIGRLPPPPRRRRRAVIGRSGVAPRPPPPTQTIDNAQHRRRRHLTRQGIRPCPVSPADSRISNRCRLISERDATKRCAQIFARYGEIKIKVSRYRIRLNKKLSLYYRYSAGWSTFQPLPVQTTQFFGDR